MVVVQFSVSTYIAWKRNEIVPVTWAIVRTSWPMDVPALLDHI